MAGRTPFEKTKPPNMATPPAVERRTENHGFEAIREPDVREGHRFALRTQSLETTMF